MLHLCFIKPNKTRSFTSNYPQMIHRTPQTYGKQPVSTTSTSLGKQSISGHTHLVQCNSTTSWRDTRFTIINFPFSAGQNRCGIFVVLMLNVDLEDRHYRACQTIYLKWIGKKWTITIRLHKTEWILNLSQQGLQKLKIRNMSNNSPNRLYDCIFCEHTPWTDYNQYFLI